MFHNLQNESIYFELLTIMYYFLPFVTALQYVHVYDGMFEVVGYKNSPLTMTFTVRKIYN